MANALPDANAKGSVVWQHEVTVQALLVAAAAFVVVTELPLAISCFAIPNLLELTEVVAIGLKKCPVVVAGHQQELD